MLPVIAVSFRSRRVATTSGSLPYSVPTTVNTATSIAQNSSRDVMPGVHDTTSWDTSLFNAYGMGVFAPDYSTYGAYVWCCNGGHEDPSNIDLVAFDLNDGLFKRFANGHGLASVRGAYGTADTNGTPYFEVSAASPSTMPSPCHVYGTLVYVPPSGNMSSSQGAICYATRGSTCAESQISRAGHIMPLNTRVWARAATGAATGGGNYEASAARDPTTGRIYVLERYPGDYGDFVVYLNPNAGSYQWGVINYGTPAPQPGDGKGVCFIHAAQRALLYHRGVNALQCIDLTNDTTIANGIPEISYSGTSPSSGNKWVYHPTNDKFYMKIGRSGNTLNVFTPGANVKAGTGSFSTITIGGSGLASSDGAHTNLHHSGLEYCPAHDCLIWMPRHDTVNLIKV